MSPEAGWCVRLVQTRVLSDGWACARKSGQPAPALTPLPLLTFLIFLSLLFLSLSPSLSRADSYGFAMREAQKQSRVALAEGTLALHKGDWLEVARASNELLALSEWITPDELDFARYLKVLVLTRLPDVASAGKAHDLAIAMASRPDLRALAQARVLAAMDTLAVKPELMAFVAANTRDYLLHLPAGAARSGRRQAELASLLPLMRADSIPVDSALNELNNRIAMGDQAYGVLIAHQALRPVLETLQPTLIRRRPVIQTLDSLTAEALFSELVLLQRLDDPIAERALRTGFEHLLKHQIRQIRRWQQPTRLKDMILGWQTLDLMPDSGSIDSAFMQLVRCESKQTDSSVPGSPAVVRLDCKPDVLGYWLPLFAESAFRIGVDNYHELSALLDQLEPVASDLEWLDRATVENVDGESDKLEVLDTFPAPVAEWFNRQLAEQESAEGDSRVNQETTILALREAGWILYRLLDYQRREQQAHLESLALRHLAQHRRRLEGYLQRLQVAD